jgi:hypothetical protein
METNSSVVPRFSWVGFAIAATGMIGVCAWEAWGHYQKSGHLDALYPVLAVWGVAYMAHRWRSIRREQTQGTFSAERYKADPIGYFRGPIREAVLWVASLVLAMVVLAVLSVLRAPQ